MGLSLWFREDVIRILRALASAGIGHGPEYRQALHDVALAFGIEGSILVCPALPPACSTAPSAWQIAASDQR